MTMGKIKFQESKIDLNNGREGQIAVFMYAGAGDPVAELDSAVSAYTDHVRYVELVDSNLDNPWLRVILSGIDQMKQEDFDPAKHKLHS